MVEGRIEAGDLRHAGCQRRTGTSGRQIMVLVQRRPRLQLRQPVHCAAVGHDRIDGSYDACSTGELAALTRRHDEGNGYRRPTRILYGVKVCAVGGAED